jgi:hypothetical protein
MVSFGEAEMISQKRFADLVGVDPKTVYRWRTEGRVVEIDGRGEVVLLKAINTAGLGRRGGRVLIPVNHHERSRAG